MSEKPVPHGESGVRFEKTDVHAPPVWRFGVALVVVTLGVAGAMVLLQDAFFAREKAGDPPRAPMTSREPGQKPPEPRLQEQPFGEIQALQAEQARLLTSYGWVDEKAGVARIPVAVAIEIVAREGLPVRGAATPPAPEKAAKPAGGAR